MTKSKLALFLVGAIAIVGIGGFAVFNQQKQATDKDVKSVSVAAVTKSALEASIFANGRVLAADERNVFPELMSGKVASISVKEGQYVEKGQVLAELSTTDLDDQIKSSRIQLEIARENLSSLRNSGQTNFDLTLKTAEKAVADAQKSLADKQALYESGAISLAEKDAATSALDRAKTELENAKRSFNNYGKESQIKIQQLSVESAQSTLDKLVRDKEKRFVKSPIDGTVFKVTAKVGDMISQAAPLFSISATANLEVISNVSEYDIDSVKVGQKAIVKGDGFEDVYAGEVTYIAAVAESVLSGQTTETVVKVKVKILDQATKFKPNFSANIEIKTAEIADAITVPYEAIYTDKDGKKTVFVVKEDKLKAFEIKTGVQGDLVVEVLGSDLADGDSVVMNPTDQLKDGDAVKILGGAGK